MMANHNVVCIAIMQYMNEKYAFLLKMAVRRHFQQESKENLVIHFVFF